MHCWTAIGYNTKSDLVFSNVPGNSNGKMTHQIYIDSIFNPVIKPRLNRGDDFVLKKMKIQIMKRAVYAILFENGKKIIN